MSLSALDLLAHAGQQIRARRAAIAAMMVQGAGPDPASDGGERLERLMDDAESHATYLAQALVVHRPALFMDYVAWARGIAAARGEPAEAVDEALRRLREAVARELGPEAAVAGAEYIDVALGSERARALPSHLEDDGQPLVTVARAYLEALLRGDRRAALRLVHDAIAGGAHVRDIYLWVFQPVQREIGRLWQINALNVAQEHYCTAVTQLAMSQLYEHVFAAERRGRVLVATCVRGELHEIGARMVADFFEMDGWDTHYLGANAPPEDVVRVVVERGADVLGISATLAIHVQDVADLVAQIRRDPGCAHVKILVGGHPFRIAPDLWREIGADGCAPDAQASITVADRLVDEARVRERAAGAAAGGGR